VCLAHSGNELLASEILEPVLRLVFEAEQALKVTSRRGTARRDAAQKRYRLLVVL